MGLLVGWLLNTRSERRAAALQLAQERRRIAADVHDLVMQDLSLALASARMLANEHTEPSRAGTVVHAGERALAGARTIVNSLARQIPPCHAAPMRLLRAGTPQLTGDSEPIARAVQASAQSAARSTRLIFDAAGVPRSAPADEATRAALLHVAREAVTNAAKHARPNAIEVTLQYSGRWRLTVRDEGEGFDAGAANGGFGLTSMRAHAQALGGALHVISTAERGTTIEAVLP